MQRVLRWPAWSKIAHLEERVAALESRRTGHENLSLGQTSPSGGLLVRMHGIPETIARPQNYTIAPVYRWCRCAKCQINNSVRSIDSAPGLGVGRTRTGL